MTGTAVHADSIISLIYLDYDAQIWVLSGMAVDLGTACGIPISEYISTGGKLSSVKTGPRFSDLSACI